MSNYKIIKDALACSAILTKSLLNIFISKGWPKTQFYYVQNIEGVNYIIRYEFPKCLKPFEYQGFCDTDHKIIWIEFGKIKNLLDEDYDCLYEALISVLSHEIMHAVTFERNILQDTNPN